MGHRKPQSSSEALEALWNLLGHKLEPRKRSIFKFYEDAKRKDLTNSETNRGWLRGQLQYIVAYGYAEKICAPGSQTVEYVLVTSKGVAGLAPFVAAQAASGAPAEHQQPESDEGPTIDQILQLIAKYQEQHPEKVFEYSFKIGGKEMEAVNR